MGKMHLAPSQVVLDLVLRHSGVIGVEGTAFLTTDRTLILATRNHRGEYVMLTLPVHFDGEPSDGPPPRWVMFQIAPAVWKVSPSILDDRLHAYLTIVGVPEPAPWGPAAPLRTETGR